jgi:hypothetical protein
MSLAVVVAASMVASMGSPAALKVAALKMSQTYRQSFQTTSARYCRAFAR